MYSVRNIGEIQMKRSMMIIVNFDDNKVSPEDFKNLGKEILDTIATEKEVKANNKASKFQANACGTCGKHQIIHYDYNTIPRRIKWICDIFKDMEKTIKKSLKDNRSK
jgi:hypothetical protein